MVERALPAAASMVVVDFMEEAEGASTVVEEEVGGKNG